MNVAIESSYPPPNILLQQSRYFAELITALHLLLKVKFPLGPVNMFPEPPLWLLI